MAKRPEQSDPEARPTTEMREKWWEVIFGTDTRGGKVFDVFLLIFILASVLIVILESVKPIREEYATEIRVAEWFFTICFTIEYIVRLWVVRRPLRYATSFFGIIDLLSIIPTYLTLFAWSAQSLVVIRILRLLRVFRVLKMLRHLGEANVLLSALRASRPKITVFVLGVLAVATIAGSLMYVIEGAESDFTSIPRGIYWAIVTMTTVGYGDITPATVVGQMIASCLMMLGFAIIAVPTGIVGADLMKEMERLRETDINKACHQCGTDGHRYDAKFCHQCGSDLTPPETGDS